MLSIITSFTGRSLINSTAKIITTKSMKMLPRLANRPSQQVTLSLPHKPRATYYFAANHQTGLTLKSLLRQLEESPDSEIMLNHLNLAMQNLLQSIRPKFSSNSNKQADFDTLLKSHLDNLDAATLTKLAEALRQAKFQCNITDSALRNIATQNNSLSDGATERQTYTLLNTAMLYARLDELITHRQKTEAETATLNFPAIEQIQSLRNLLADCILCWQHNSQPHNIHATLLDAAQKFSLALALPNSPDSVAALPLPTRPSLVEWTDSRLLTDPALASIQPDTNLITKALRDVLETILMKKIFGADASLTKLMPVQLAILRNNIDAVINQSPSYEISAELHACASRVMAQADNFGTVQIMPASGNKLGHAWIAPHLSVIPNRNYSGYRSAGTSFLQTGSSTTPKSVPMMQWQADFLSEAVNEKKYPANEALPLTVPVPAERLQSSALQTKAHWQDNALPYLFMGTEPGINPSGCRVTVWHAVTQGMDKDAQTLFAHFNRGLPDPDSPTELWQRLDGLMRWIRQLANEA